MFCSNKNMKNIIINNKINKEKVAEMVLKIL